MRSVISSFTSARSSGSDSCWHVLLLCLLAQEAAGLTESVQKSAHLALDEDDFQTVTVENKLGCDVYLKKMEDDSDMINLLPDNGHATLWIPPPRYSDRLNVSDESREPRCYVGIQIVEAKVIIYLL